MQKVSAGYYDTEIRWGAQKIEARAFGAGYWGKRIPQHKPRVDAYELKINPNNESYYVPSPDGGFVQFENLVGDTVQDGKLVEKTGSSWYRPSQLATRMQPIAQGKILAEARRQIEAARAHQLEVEWLVSDQAVVDEMTELFQTENVNIRVTFLAE